MFFLSRVPSTFSSPRFIFFSIVSPPLHLSRGCELLLQKCSRRRVYSSQKWGADNQAILCSLLSENEAYGQWWRVLKQAGRCEKQSIITSAASWWGCIVRLFLAVSYIQGCFRKSGEGGGARRDAINLLSASSSVSSCFFSPSWMQMRQRGGNIECDQTLKRTRHLNVWQITTTRLFISLLTSMMDVSTHTHTCTQASASTVTMATVDTV